MEDVKGEHVEARSFIAESQKAGRIRRTIPSSEPSVGSLKLVSNAAITLIRFCLLTGLSPPVTARGAGVAKSCRKTSPSGKQTNAATFYLQTPSKSTSGTADLWFQQYAETGIWTVAYAYVIDNVGNQHYYYPPDFAALGWPTQISVGKQDNIPPTTAVTMAPSPNANNWNNSNTTITLTASNNAGGTGVRQIAVSLSGAQTGSTVITGSTAQITVSAQGITTVSYFATDNAGNQESAKTVIVRIDKTAPVATATPTPAPNANGWNNTSVIVSFTGTDNLSGINSCTAPISLSVEGASLSATGACTDNAGNVSAPATAKVNIDKTPPLISGMPATGCSL